MCFITYDIQQRGTALEQRYMIDFGMQISWHFVEYVCIFELKYFGFSLLIFLEKRGIDNLSQMWLCMCICKFNTLIVTLSPEYICGFMENWYHFG